MTAHTLKINIHCSMCGHEVKIVGTNEGTNHYEPVEPQIDEEARAEIFRLGYEEGFANAMQSGDH